MTNGYLYLIFAAFSYASMGILVKIISVDTGPLLQTFLRLTISALLTTLIVLLNKKTWFLKQRRDYLIIILMGVIGYGIQLSLFTLSIYHTTIGNALFLFSGYPIVTAFLAYFFLKERVTKRLLLSLILLAIALFLIFQPGSLGTSLLGNLYALGVCFTFSLYVIGSRILSKRGNSSETITLWSVWIAVITTGMLTGLFEQITLAFSLQSLILISVFGILNATAFLFVNKGFATVPAGIGTMILMLEPILGTILGLLFFQEIPTVLFVIGGAILIAAVAIATTNVK